MHRELTFKRMLQLHRRLWTWIALKALRERHFICKNEFPMFKNMNITNNCFLCEYANDRLKSILLGKIRFNKHNCYPCPPMKTGSICDLCIDTNHCNGEICKARNSLYNQYKECGYTEYKKMANIAFKIANLPFEKGLYES